MHRRAEKAREATHLPPSTPRPNCPVSTVAPPPQVVDRRLCAAKREVASEEATIGEDFCTYLAYPSALRPRRTWAPARLPAAVPASQVGRPRGAPVQTRLRNAEPVELSISPVDAADPSAAAQRRTWAPARLPAAVPASQVGPPRGAPVQTRLRNAEPVELTHLYLLDGRLRDRSVASMPQIRRQQRNERRCH